MTVQRHGNDPGYVVRESQRLFPLDLVARIDWLHEQAHASISEADRHEVLTAIRRLRNGTKDDQ